MNKEERIRIIKTYKQDEYNKFYLFEDGTIVCRTEPYYEDGSLFGGSQYSISLQNDEETYRNLLKKFEKEPYLASNTIAKQTADKMFKELGYTKLIDNEAITLYIEDHEDENENTIIQIYKQLNEPMYCKYAESKSEDIKTHEALRITMAEHNAICKKLEELKKPL